MADTAPKISESNVSMVATTNTEIEDLPGLMPPTPEKSVLPIKRQNAYRDSFFETEDVAATEAAKPLTMSREECPMQASEVGEVLRAVGAAFLVGCGVGMLLTYTYSRGSLSSVVCEE